MKRLLFSLLLTVLLLRTQAQTPDSLDLKIGQMIMFGLYGTNADKTLLKEIEKGYVGGILIYERNITPKNSATNLRQLIAACQQKAPIKLFTSIDHEGGLVNRLKTKYGFPSFPSAEFLGRLDNADSTKWYADNAAYTLSRLGINLNYAPVLDVKNANNPVLGSRERCYSTDIMNIVRQAGRTILSHDYFNVGTVVKHFPGHGNSTTDSHLGLTDVSRTWQPRELLPYKVLIDSGLVDAVMTAHIVNTQLDASKLPGTLSKKMITGLLRDSLGFKGVVFTDDMQMRAISDQYGFEDAIRKSIEAGVDVLMFSNNIQGVGETSPTEVHRIIKKLVQKGLISEARINASYNRIMELKSKKDIDFQHHNKNAWFYRQINQIFSLSSQNFIPLHSQKINIIRYGQS